MFLNVFILPAVYFYALRLCERIITQSRKDAKRGKHKIKSFI